VNLEDFDLNGIQRYCPELRYANCPVCRQPLAGQPGWLVALATGERNYWLCKPCAYVLMVRRDPWRAHV
jgi:hypothetical protein